ncbi:MAG: DUF6531 domain-containing protein [Myxococcales bacterium]
MTGPSLRCRLHLGALITLVCTLAASPAHAGVSYRNGNFFIGYSDLSFAGGMELKIDRVFNSKSSYKGMFGFGWGSDYEVFLRSYLDGSVVVSENGGGAKNAFFPVDPADIHVEREVEAVIAARAKKETLAGPALASYGQTLRNDERFRHDEADRWLRGTALPEIPEGTRLISSKFSFQYLVRTPEGFRRVFDNGQVQTFDRAGLLVRIADAHGSFVELSRDDSGRIVRLSDDFGRWISLEYQEVGFVARATTSSGQTAEYRYRGLDPVWMRDSDGDGFSYRYSADGRMNLVGIGYLDGSSLQVGYYPVTMGESVAFIEDRDGSLLRYRYGGDGPGGLVADTTVERFDPEWKVISTSRYEYEERVGAGGRRYTYRLTSDENGDVTSTIYSAPCGVPLEIKHGGEYTRFLYDPLCHVTRKETPVGLTELEYSAVGKVSRVKKSARDGAGWKLETDASYSYDEAGNLMHAEGWAVGEDRRSLDLEYDAKGRIKEVRGEKTLRFTYNQDSRPTKIEVLGLGSIDVTYTEKGDIKNVESAGGKQAALQVTSIFQQLLDLIRPAGVSLSF